VPLASDLDDTRAVGSMPESWKPEYQLLLARAWAFAEDRKVPGMQNNVMKQFFLDTQEVQDLSQAVLQDTLRRYSTVGSARRRAVLEEALWLEEKKGSKLPDGLKVNLGAGFSYDMVEARKVFEKRKKGRGKAELYYVKVPG